MERIILPVAERVSRELILEDRDQPLDLEGVFGNRNPVELEIGIGKGLFIKNAAELNPDVNYLGVEIRRKYLNKARDRIEKRHLPNVRLLCGEAFSFMEDWLPPASLTTVHVYFPDPWPKKRHQKRRLFSKAFIALVHRALTPGGLLLVATDHADYWTWIQETLAAQTLLTPCDALPEPPGEAAGLTNYEIKYQIEGRRIYRTGLQKPETSP